MVEYVVWSPKSKGWVATSVCDSNSNNPIDLIGSGLYLLIHFFNYQFMSFLIPKWQTIRKGTVGG